MKKFKFFNDTKPTKQITYLYVIVNDDVVCSKEILHFIFTGLSNISEIGDLIYTAEICLGTDMNYFRDLLPFFSLGSKVNFRITKTYDNDIANNEYVGTVINVVVGGQINFELTIENNNY